MKTFTFHRCCLVFAVLIMASARAQTTTWIASGSNGSTADWNVSAHWSPASVPISGTVVINETTNTGISPLPGGALPVFTGGATLGELRFELPPRGTTQFTGVYVGSPTDASANGHLRFDGAGLTISPANATTFAYIDLHLQPGSYLDFLNRATITRTGTPVLRFWLNSSATTPANLRFYDDASAGTGALQSANLWYSGLIRYEFHDRSTAGSGNSFALGPGSMAEFYDQASAGGSTFVFGYTGPNNNMIIRFGGSSTAGQSTIRSVNNQVGAVEFVEQATGGTASLQNIRRLDLTGASTGTGTTGRLRATTSTLAPASVVADDARTISLREVNVWDVLLGSNTLEVGSGYIGNLRDSGGAYLSAAGENLIGGSLVKVGAGTLNLYAPSYNPADPAHPYYNVISSTSTVKEGTLYLDNRLASVVVESAGTLGGSGIVDGNLFNQGRVSAASWQGLRVTGNYTQATSGIFESRPYSEYANADNVRGLLINGTASLAGRLVTFAYAGMFPNRTPGTLEFKILAAGAINGRFDSIDTTGQSVRILTTVNYQPTLISLRFDLLPIVDLAATPSQRALGAYLDHLYVSNSVNFPNNYNAIVDGLNLLTEVGSFRRSLDNFAPDRYGAVPDNALTAALARRTALDRLMTTSNLPSTGGSCRVFFEGSRRDLTLKSSGGLPETTARTTGGTAGVSWHRGPWTLGAYLAKEQTKGDLDAVGSRTEVDSVEPGLFAQYAAKGFFANAATASSRDRHTLVRMVDYVYFGNTIQRNEASPRGTRQDLSLTVGYDWNADSLTLSPFLGAVYSRWQVDDFTESNSAGLKHEPLAISGWEVESRNLRAGAVLSANLGRGKVRPSLTVTRWRELETDRSIPTRFVGASRGYLAPGRAPDRDLTQVSLGLDWKVGRRLTVTLAADGFEGENTRTSREYSAGVRWVF